MSLAEKGKRQRQWQRKGNGKERKGMSATCIGNPVAKRVSAPIQLPVLEKLFWCQVGVVGAGLFHSWKRIWTHLKMQNQFGRIRRWCGRLTFLGSPTPTRKESQSRWWWWWTSRQKAYWITHNTSLRLIYTHVGIFIRGGTTSKAECVLCVFVK